MIEHIIIDSDHIILSDHIPFRHPLGQVAEWLPPFHHVLDESPFILSCKELLVSNVFWILGPLVGEFL